MRHSFYFYAGLLCFAGIAPAFANQPAEEAAAAEAASLSKTQQLAQAALTKSSEVAKKLSVNANAAQADEEKDPFEAFNRKMYAFNEALDNGIARPLAIQYVEKVPDEVRSSYRQFRKNLNEPWNAVNQLIQGRPARAAKSLGRFTVNTLTTLGFADPARRLNLTSEAEGFGITLGYYGVPSGPYLVLPVFGPSTIREGAGLAVDSQARPQKYLLEDHDGAYWSEQALRGIDARSQLLDLESTLQGDKYAQIRDFYLQRISFAVSEKKGIAEDSLFFDDDAELDEDVDPAADAPENSSEDDSGAPDSGNAATE